MEKLINDWEIRWIYRSHSSISIAEQRSILAEQVRKIRTVSGNIRAKQFTRQLIWVGCYPPAMHRFAAKYGLPS